MRHTTSGTYGDRSEMSAAVTNEVGAVPVTDTAPTPERRLDPAPTIRRYEAMALTSEELRKLLYGTTTALFRVEGERDDARTELAATLNEAETLRAERDRLERVLKHVRFTLVAYNSAEAACTEVRAFLYVALDDNEEAARLNLSGFPEATQRSVIDRARALARAETPAAATIAQLEREMDEARERVRVLESLVADHHNAGVMHVYCVEGSVEKNWGRRCPVCRALAGAETPAPDAGEMLGGVLREQASRRRAGADGGERRG